MHWGTSSTVSFEYVRVGYEELRAGLEPIEQGLVRDYPQANTGRVFAVQSLLESIVGNLGPTLKMLLGASESCS